MSKLVIRPHRPWRIWLTLLLLPLLLALLALAGFEVGRSHFSQEVTQLTSDIDHLRHLNRRLESELSQLRTESVQVMRSAGIDRNACDQLRLDLERQQIDLIAMEEEIAFYRGIITPPEGLRGVQIRQLEVTQLTGSHHRARLSLTQLHRQQQAVSGSIRIAVSGIGENGVTELDHGELAIEPAPLFNFLYFEYIDFDFDLPPQFRPLQVKVTLQLKRSGKKRDKGDSAAPSREFDWSEVTGQARTDHAESGVNDQEPATDATVE